MKKKTKMIRYRFNVPEDDKIVLSWMNAQHTKSLSLRAVIKAYAEKNGYSDVFATAVEEAAKEGFAEAIEEEVDTPIEKEEENVVAISAKKRLEAMQGVSSSVDDLSDLLNQ